MNAKKMFLGLFVTVCFATASYGQKCVSIETEYGTMNVKLYDETPLHRDNFVKLVESGFYNDLLFHRVIKDFMVQGGDPESKNAVQGQMLGSGGPDYTIPAEIKREFSHKKGALAAARQGDQVNPERRSSGSQFYIVQNNGGTPHLDGAYTVFGEVVKGIEVVDKIADQRVDRRDRPEKDIRMKMQMMTCPK